MKKHYRWWLFAGLWGLSLVQYPLLASQNISSPEPAGEGNFEAYLSGLRERALNGDPAAARELAVHYDVEGNAAETSKWMSEYVSLAEKRANNGDVDSMLDLGKLFCTQRTWKGPGTGLPGLLTAVMLRHSTRWL